MFQVRARRRCCCDCSKAFGRRDSRPRSHICYCKLLWQSSFYALLLTLRRSSAQVSTPLALLRPSVRQWRQRRKMPCGARSPRPTGSRRMSTSLSCTLPVRHVFNLVFAQRLTSSFDLSGTASGDPTEANWVGAEFKRDGELALGSVKGNVGYVYETFC